MIPPVVLDPQPHHAVLDMCAAPGSKTGQLLEMMGVVSHKGGEEPKGFVVANDSDVQRAYMVVSQIRRLNSPSIFVTSCDAQRFPLQRHPATDTAEDVALEGIFDLQTCYRCHKERCNFVKLKASVIMIQKLFQGMKIK